MKFKMEEVMGEIVARVGARPLGRFNDATQSHIESSTRHAVATLKRREHRAAAEAPNGFHCLVSGSALACLLALVLSLGFAHQAHAAARPNILLILADDLGYSDLGCYGGEIKTPNLDSLAANGVRFTQFYNGTRCCPTRASLLSGLYAHQAGVGDMTGDAGPQKPGYRGFLQPNAVIFPQVLGPAGYRTFMVGKWHLTEKSGPVNRGFEEFYGMIGGFNSFFDEKPFYSRRPAGRQARTYATNAFYSTDVFVDYSIDFLNLARQTPDKPWFLYLAFNAPHFPLHAYESDIAKYEDFYLRGWDKVRDERLERQKKMGLVAKDTQLTPRSAWHHPFHNRDGVNPAWDSLPEDRRRDLARRMAVYAAMVDRMDQQIGRLLADLRTHKEYDNTLIMFLSDNGACAEWDPNGFDVATGPKTTNILHTASDMKTVGAPGSYISYGSGWANACNTPWRWYKHYGHEGGISTPFIAHWPAGIKARGELRTQTAHIVDLMATFVDLGKATYPTEVNGKKITPAEGISLMPAFQNQPLKRDYLAWEHEGNRALRAGDWKITAVKDQPWELYNIAKDRVELNDLAAKEPERVKKMAAQWEEWAKRVGAEFKPGAN